jgi:hypothetical protein
MCVAVTRAADQIMEFMHKTIRRLGTGEQAVALSTCPVQTDPAPLLTVRVRSAPDAKANRRCRPQQGRERHTQVHACIRCIYKAYRRFCYANRRCVRRRLQKSSADARSWGMRSSVRGSAGCIGVASRWAEGSGAWSSAIRNSSWRLSKRKSPARRPGVRAGGIGGRASRRLRPLRGLRIRPAHTADVDPRKNELFVGSESRVAQDELWI